MATQKCCSLQISLYHQEQASQFFFFTNIKKLATKVLTIFLVLSFFELMGVCFTQMKGLMHGAAMLDSILNDKKVPDLNVVLIRVVVL